jgi:hypothetical protein
MENPRTVHRLGVALLVTFAAAAVAASIYYETLLLLPAFVGIAIAFYLVCLPIAFLNILIFGPILRLIAMMDARLTRRRQETPANLSHDHSR